MAEMFRRVFPGVDAPTASVAACRQCQAVHAEAEAARYRCPVCRHPDGSGYAHAEHVLRYHPARVVADG